MSETAVLQRFSVPVCRIGYGFTTIEVEAASQEEANNLALDQAGDHLFSEKTSDYVLDGGETPGEAQMRQQMDELAKALVWTSQLLRGKTGGFSGQEWKAFEDNQKALNDAGYGHLKIWR